MTRSEEVTYAFYDWETKLRGWGLYEVPVEIEPPFEYFTQPERGQMEDDGVIRLFPSFKSRKKTSEPVEPPQPKEFEVEQELRTLEIAFGAEHSLEVDKVKHFLVLVSRSLNPVTFEVLARAGTIIYRLIAYDEDFQMLQALFESYFPGLACVEAETTLPFVEEQEIGIVDIGLDSEVFIPITGLGKDPLLHKGLLTLLGNFSRNEGAIVQVTFKGANAPWGKALVDATTTSDNQPFFVDAPQFTDRAKEKASSALFAVRMRIACQAEDDQSTNLLSKRILESLRPYRSEGGDSNQFIYIDNVGIPYEVHLHDLVNTTAHRTGFLLTLDELAGLVHFPSVEHLPRSMVAETSGTYPVDSSLQSGQYSIGVNSHAGVESEVFLSDTERLKHMHVLGATGVGKSTFLVSLALEDAEAHNGFTVLDPHGDLVDDIIASLPEHRLKDVVLFDPSDVEHPIGINLLEAKSDAEKIILNSDLISVFQSQATSWGDQMTNIVQMAIAAFIESSDPGTLMEFRQFLQNEGYREKVLMDVQDPMVRSFWLEDFKTYRKGATAPILTRLNAFLGPKTIRHIMGVSKGLQFNEILNGKKILLAKLSQGQIGVANSTLLGVLLLSKLYQAALARQSTDRHKRHVHYLYIDEFHNFLTPTMSSILTGVRKYNLGLVLAHQNLDQLNRKDGELRSTLLANAFNRVAFRVGDDDARILARGTEHFEENDYLNLGTGNAIVRVGRAHQDFNLLTRKLADDADPNGQKLKKVVEYSRKYYATDKSDAEESINRLFGSKIPVSEPVAAEVIATDKESKEEGLKDFEEQAEEVHQSKKKERSESLHRYLQESVRSMAQSMGWRATIEAEVPGGRIDVLLERAQDKVGVEVSVTNSDDYEMGNITKCLQHCSKVILIAPDEDKRKRLYAKANDLLPSEELNKVQILDEPGFGNWLTSSLPIPATEQKTIAGYRVKVSYSDTPDKEERKKSIIDAVLRKRSKKGL